MLIALSIYLILIKDTRALIKSCFQDDFGYIAKETFLSGHPGVALAVTLTAPKTLIVEMEPSSHLVAPVNPA